MAGNGTAGFSGDNGPATSAELNVPAGVAVDSAGNLYIADYGNNRIRKVSNGVITTVAGNGTAGFSGDNGPATSAELNMPGGVAVDSAGNLYIADTQQPHPQGLERRDHHGGGKRNAWFQRRQRPGHQRAVERSCRASPWIPPATCTSPTTLN